MKRLLASLLLAVLVFLPSATTAFPVATDTETLTELGTWAGCKNLTVVYEDTPGEFNAYFTVTSDGPLIVFLNAKHVPEEYRFIIFLHEVGHCQQWYEGLLGWGADRKAIELDADARAAKLACALYQDGPGLLRSVMEWFRAEFGYEGDWSHGTLAERIAQGELAKSWCPSDQAPFRSI